MDGYSPPLPPETSAAALVQPYLRADAGITVQQLAHGAFGTYPHRDPRFVAETAELLKAMGSVLVTDKQLVRRETIMDSIAAAMPALPYHIVFCNHQTDRSKYSKKEIGFGEKTRRIQIAIFIDPIEELRYTSLLLNNEHVIEIAGKPRVQAVEEIAGCLASFMGLRAPANIERIVAELDGSQSRWFIPKFLR